MKSNSKKLEAVNQEILSCEYCLEHARGKKLVPGEGSIDAEVVFLGEAPGRKEAETGRPFVGRSGQLLRSLIAKIGLSDQEVFITSTVKYLPEKKTPDRQDIDHGRIHLSKQLEVINPKLVVLLGSVAQKGVWDEPLPVLANHGQVVQKGRSYFVTLHPAAALRIQKLKPLLESDFGKLKNQVKKI